MRWPAVCLLIGACSFKHGALSGDRDGGGPSEAGAVDGRTGAVDARPIDAPRPDAMPCPSSAPSGCGTAVYFYCPGSNSCFAFCPSTKSHSNSETACASWTTGAHLASPVDAELMCVAQKMAVTTINGDNVWIGLHQTGSPATPGANWSWLDGTPYTASGWNQSPLQPDDYDGVENGTEDCGNLERSFNWLWNDGSCSDPHPFLCERP